MLVFCFSVVGAKANMVHERLSPRIPNHTNSAAVMMTIAQRMRVNTREAQRSQYLPPSMPSNLVPHRRH